MHRSVDPVFEASKKARGYALNQTRWRLVLDGASRVFSRDGLDGATMRSIAAEAGCTTGAIYPLFQSKEAIYAALLAESLERLHGAVAVAAGAAAPPSKRLMNAARAFLTYYRDRPDEVALGLYLWHGLRPRGLSRDLDKGLNRRLAQTLDLLKEQLRALGHLDEAAARLETSALFSFLIGALIVDQTGRLRLFETGLDDLTEAHLLALTQRLGLAESCR